MKKSNSILLGILISLLTMGCQQLKKNPANSRSIASVNNSGAPCIDNDGDGWGWDGKNSCKMPQTTPATSSALPAGNTQNYIPDPNCRDDDGDGWGWDGEKSCQVVPSVQTTYQPVANTNGQESNNSECVDEDGDGWGWDGKKSCQINPTTTPTSTTIDVNANCPRINSNQYRKEELVTDVILTAGQSNAAGNKTLYQPGSHAEDRVNQRLIVWTQNNRWEVANPQHQVWDLNKFPKQPGGVYFNHPAFQIGRAITNREPCRVVAIIPTSAPGMPIKHWLDNVDNHFDNIDNRVQSALAQLPQKSQVDMIWWMQGEADNDPDAHRYYLKVKSLIGRFRSKSWFDNYKYFLANETGWFPYVNRALHKLRNDDDRYSDYSKGEDRPKDPFPHISSESDRVHFNEVALRKIGNLVADKYLKDYLGLR